METETQILLNLTTSTKVLITFTIQIFEIRSEFDIFVQKRGYILSFEFERSFPRKNPILHNLHHAVERWGRWRCVAADKPVFFTRYQG